ncbi:MAG: DNA mismatch repair protein MutS [bacterium]
MLSGLDQPVLDGLREKLPDLPEIVALLEESLVDDPPQTIKEGGLLKPGFSKEVDELRELRGSGKAALARMEQAERERTGINSLKIKYNKVFGYYIEITRSNLNQVPDDYIRKQTLVNAERFITPELKSYETRLLSAEEELGRLEYEIFLKIRGEVLSSTPKIQSASKQLAEIDCQSGLAELAAEYNYTRPEITGTSRICIKAGRHPVVERLTERFIPNDCLLDGEENRLLMITGPNMAGKSTYMRQVALLVLLAQAGSFIPAKRAEIGAVRQIFTRVGASDNLSQGMSTFMVEMSETANIINNAAPGSLIIIDEIGRGTSTYDGVSIAEAVAEHLVERPGLKTLFATHYHELTDLADRLPGIINYNVAVKESEQEIVFLYKIVPGHATSSYGIQVARLAGLPGELIARALEVLDGLEDRQRKMHLIRKSDRHRQGRKSKISTRQLNLFSGIKR